MKLKDYKKETLRTLPNLGNSVLNSLHMTVGICTEVGELAEAILLGSTDRVNLIEELSGDIPWYLINYANMHGIEVDDLRTTNFTLTPEENDIDFLFKRIVSSSSKLLDLDKKLMAYNKPVLDTNRRAVFLELFEDLMKLISFYNIDLEEGLSKNINKLRLRFPEKFDANKAINRNTELEYKILS